MNLASILHDEGARHEAAPAIVHRGRAVTFGALDRAASGAARRLASEGIRPGDRVLLLVPMSIELYAVLIALLRLRATAVLVDPSAGRERLAHCVERVAPEAMIGGPRGHLLRLVSPAVRRIRRQVVVAGWAPIDRKAHV